MDSFYHLNEFVSLQSHTPIYVALNVNVVYDNVINMTSFGIRLHAALVETQGNSTQCHTKYMHSQTVPYDLYGTVICARVCDKWSKVIISFTKR